MDLIIILLVLFLLLLIIIPYTNYSNFEFFNDTLCNCTPSYRDGVKLIRPPYNNAGYYSPCRIQNVYIPQPNVLNNPIEGFESKSISTSKFSDILNKMNMFKEESKKTVADLENGLNKMNPTKKHVIKSGNNKVNEKLSNKQLDNMSKNRIIDHDDIEQKMKQIDMIDKEIKNNDKILNTNNNNVNRKVQKNTVDDTEQRLVKKDYQKNLQNFKFFPTDQCHIDYPNYTGAFISGENIVCNNLKWNQSRELEKDNIVQPEFDVILDKNGSIENINIIDGGKGFKKPPKLEVISKDQGNGAVLEAILGDNGTIVVVDIVKDGSKYQEKPEIVVKRSVENGGEMSLCYLCSK